MQVWNLLEEEEKGAGAAQAGTWASLSPPGSHKHRDMGECSCHASIHGFLRITQDLGSCCLLGLHSWCTEPCRIQSDTHICGSGMEKETPCAEEPIRRLREPGECWPGHHSGPGEAAESQQRLPGMCPMEMLHFPGLSGRAGSGVLGWLGAWLCYSQHCQRWSSAEETGSKLCQDYFGNSEVENAWA